MLKYFYQISAEVYCKPIIGLIASWFTVGLSFLQKTVPILHWIALALGLIATLFSILIFRIRLKKEKLNLIREQLEIDNEKVKLEINKNLLNSTPMKNIFILIIITVIALSCSPQKRLSRLLSHHPELMAQDTVFVKDTFVIGPEMIDTIFDLPVMADTVMIEKEKIKVQIIKQPVPGKIRVIVERRVDTVFRTKPIYVNKIVNTPLTENKWYDAVWFQYLCLILAILIIWFIISVRK